MDRVDLSRGPVLLTPPTSADEQRIATLCQDPEVARWTTVPSPYSPDDAAFFLRNVVDPGWEGISPTWALWSDGELQGMVGLTDQGDGAWEVGYWLGPEARGRGLMTIAVQAVMEFARDTLGAQVLTWTCLILDGEPNWASWAVAWRLGFRLEGTLRKHGRQRGQRVDALVGSWVPGDPIAPAQPWTGPVRGAVGAHPAFPDPRDPEALVRQFHEVYRLPIVADGPDVDRERVHMRVGLITEECAELVGAVYGEQAEQILLQAVEAALATDDGTRDTVETADALADLIYVIYGMALEMGISLEWVLAEVQASNLSKLGEDGEPIYRKDGKVLKGPHFRQPDIAAALDRAPRRMSF